MSYADKLDAEKIPAHAAAARDALLDIVVQLSNGVTPEELGRLVVQIGTMMERKI